MKRLFDVILGEPGDCNDAARCHDTREAERRHERAVRESKRTMERADRSIRDALRELQDRQPSWEGLLGKSEGEER